MKIYIIHIHQVLEYENFDDTILVYNSRELAQKKFDSFVESDKQIERIGWIVDENNNKTCYCTYPEYNYAESHVFCELIEDELICDQ